MTGAKRGSRKPKVDPWCDPSVEACACSQLRKTARAVSSLYDEFLAECGLTVTQYGLLVNIARAEGISRTALAAQLGMERTTLTRNLRPLELDGLIGEKIGADRRARVLQLTPAGRQRLRQGFPQWQRAQRAFFKNFGQKRFEELRALLTSAWESAKNAGLGNQ